MTNPIIESGMCFGPYLDEDLFKIETSSQYTTNLLSNGIKSCEFIVKKNGDICFVEAKTSNPKEIEEESPEEKKKKYEAYISDIATKMQDSISAFYWGNTIRTAYVQIYDTKTWQKETFDLSWLSKTRKKDGSPPYKIDFVAR